MRRAFTLIELLVVVAIMGLMGTIAVGGYRQMQQGMEESTVVDSVEKFLSLAKERALIDRKPTAVYCWNEMLREATEDENAVYVGRAVAIRMKGRISRVTSGWIADEYGDLEQIGANGDYEEAPTKKLPTRIYCMDSISSMSSGIKYSTVRDVPQTQNGKADNGQQEFYMTAGQIQSDADESASGLSKEDGIEGNIIQYGYYIEDAGTAGGKWKVGAAYGMEFQSLELPHNFIFESALPTSMSSPTKDVKTIVYQPDMNSTEGVSISAYKPGSSGSMTAVGIGTATPQTISRKE